MTALPSAPIRDEHRELLPHIEHLRETADAIGRVAPYLLREKVEQDREFLVDHLVPHARAEDEVLYPEVATLMGAAKATATMTRDHVEVARLISDLETLRAGGVDDLDPQRENELRRVLYGLYTLVKTHFDKEEEIYLALVDERLTIAEFARVYARMERAASRSMSAAG